MRAQSLIRSLRTIPPQRSLPRTLLVRHPQAIATVPTSRLYSTPPTSEAADKSEDASAVDEEDLSKKLASVEEVRDQLEKKTEELQTKVAGLEKDQLYQRAEIQTLVRRIGEEKAKASEFAITSFARSLLSTSDVLSTALKSVPQPIDPGDAALTALFGGVQLTQRAMHKTFDDNGVKKMDVGRGTTFDPNLHEATFHIPPEVAGERGEGKEWGKGEVVEVTKEGWMIGNRVLRPAQVGVTALE